MHFNKNKMTIVIVLLQALPYFNIIAFPDVLNEKWRNYIGFKISFTIQIDYKEKIKSGLIEQNVLPFQPFCTIIVTQTFSDFWLFCVWKLVNISILIQIATPYLLLLGQFFTAFSKPLTKKLQYGIIKGVECLRSSAG